MLLLDIDQVQVQNKRFLEFCVLILPNLFEIHSSEWCYMYTNALKVTWFHLYVLDVCKVSADSQNRHAQDSPLSTGRKLINLCLLQVFYLLTNGCSKCIVEKSWGVIILIVTDSGKSTWMDARHMIAHDGWILQMSTRRLRSWRQEHQIPRRSQR